MTLIISNDESGETDIVKETDMADEAELQEFIHENPEAIPFYEINGDKEIAVAVREFTVEGGESIDALGFDQDGGIYVIETKLDRNADKRQVIAQAFDYGAALWDYQHPTRLPRPA